MQNPRLLKAKIRLQNRLTLRDLPSRGISIALATLLALYYLPWQFAAVFFSAYLLIELAGVLLMRHMERQITRRNVVGLLLLAFFGASEYAGLSVGLWLVEGSAPKIAAFVLMVTSLLHVVIIRSVWIPFGIVTAAPLLLGLTGSVTSYVLRTAEVGDALVALGMFGIMIAYIFRSMWDIYCTRSELLDATDRAEEASRAKSRFLASMSHEIRTPLNAIHGMAQLLREDADPERTGERASILMTSATSLKAIVDDVLDHAKVEAGRFELRPELASLAEEVATVVEMFRGAADEKGLALDLEVAPSVPSDAQFDALRVRQVVSNLVSNAVKFTSAGRVLVRAEAAPEAAGWRARVVVTDTGRGLAESEVTNLFKEFARVEPAARSRENGTGLGLMISRGFARLMDGDIEVSSSQGEGATFTFVFTMMTPPKTAGMPAAGPEAPQERLARVRAVLLVDDNASNRYVVRAFLKNLDLAVTEAENGEIALECLSAAPYDLVLLDMHMPVMDGQATVRAMREMDPEVAATPVIALTADAADEDRDRYLALGMAGYLSKPIERASLLAEIARVTETPCAAA